MFNCIKVIMVEYSQRVSACLFQYLAWHNFALYWVPGYSFFFNPKLQLLFPTFLINIINAASFDTYEYSLKKTINKFKRDQWLFSPDIRTNMSSNHSSLCVNVCEFGVYSIWLVCMFCCYSLHTCLMCFIYFYTAVIGAEWNSRTASSGIVTFT